MRLRAAGGVLVAVALMAGCASEPAGGLQVVDEVDHSPPPERIATAAQSSSNECVTASAGNPSEFVSAALTADSENLVVTFEFERPYTLGPSAPLSVSMTRPERLVVEVGSISAYAFLSPDHQKKAVSYVIRDESINGDVIPGASLDVDGDELIMTVPLPADMTPYASTPLQWKAEAQGVDCPGDADFDVNWLWTDILMSTM